jgi:hypothetical protein
MKKFVVAGQKCMITYYVEGLGDTILASLYIDQNTAITKEFISKDKALSWVSYELQKMVGD